MTCLTCGADPGTVGVLKPFGSASKLCEDCLRRELLHGVYNLPGKLGGILALRRALLETLEGQNIEITRPALLLILKRDYFDSTTVGNNRLVDLAELVLDLDEPTPQKKNPP